MGKDMKCPKCKEGTMTLPLVPVPLEHGELETRKDGKKFVCIKCGHRAHPSEIYPRPSKSN